MSSDDLIKLSENYVSAFHARNLNAVAALLHDEFSLTDPNVRDCHPKANALQVIRDLFETAGASLSFTARKIYRDGNTTMIEFDLAIGNMRLEGMDIIEWRDAKLYRMRAYLNQL